MTVASLYRFACAAAQRYPSHTSDREWKDERRDYLCSLAVVSVE
jgi:hypothetical protein